MVHDYLEGSIVRDISNGQEMKITAVRKGLFDDAPSGYVVCEWEEDGVAQKREFHVDNIEFMSEGDAKPYDIDKQGSCESSSKRGLFTLILFLLLGLDTKAYDFEKDYIYYNILTDSTVEVTRIDNNTFDGAGSYAGRISIPETVQYGDKRYTVTEIGGSAFKNSVALISVQLPNCIKIINYGAFDGCINLRDVYLSDSLQIIASFSFDECKSLERIVIPDNVTSIGDYAFYKCTNLKTITVGKNVKTFGTHAFRECSNLDTLICKSKTPIAVNFSRYETSKNHWTISGDNPFVDCPTSSTVLIVPFGSVEFYKAEGTYWEYYFKNIQELKFKLTFTVDGTKHSEDSVAFGAPIVYPEIEKKEDHEFIWENTLGEMPINDLVINGHYKKNTFYLTYVIDGVEYKKEKVVIGTPLNLIDNPTKEGHTFSGWSEIPAIMPENDVTITGSFTKNTYKLTYLVDGMTYMSSYVTYGDAIFPMTPPVKEGYTFSGWSEIPATMPASDVVVTGSFEVNGIENITNDMVVDVYNLQGIKVKEQVLFEDLESILPKGMYIVNGNKVAVE